MTGNATIVIGQLAILALDTVLHGHIIPAGGGSLN
jgi:hypothetical protein